MLHSTLPNGVYTATLTPLKKNLSVDYDLLIAHCRWLLDNGCQGIALLGTTGEANAFSLQERRRILEAVVKGGIPSEKLLVGTGCCSLPETVNLTRHALQYGVGGLLVLPPFYYKVIAEKGLRNYFDLFIKKVKDDRLRIYLYHFPKMSGIPFSIPFIQKLTKDYPGIVVGIKDSSGDFENMKAMVKNIPNFQVFAGTEKFLLDILKIGGAGCVSATANVTTPLAAAVYQSWKAGENAENLQAHLVKVRAAFEGLPFSGALKSYLADLKSDSRWLGIRPPNELLEKEVLENLKSRLKMLVK